ncbi:CoA-acylating methylmalonate-semialdehyde dehydrogenase [Ferrimonas balearica]|uniref:CoA-acylating methylmalonate-semialdehyde dehydrogenase n=1 Tax=Ferrimonas balearica TaxID=44012 RepID=UPI001C58DA38|nr:CoA-acylating methylmalonate-semialdehyde dehydrogenase [Ferrimonas balearica]MBW3138134.1 CoA-acylating methylmalonate-semialdehyde dehydrogenase [Ferrimonas balearica]MBW3164310.1 CoA-acylating methylmalonate-semialdehyde dehydrogenase [Ferrimonas balearica]MBY5978891.1 CoA-acylating methylmalonate-semialdehyde dehydrogenase [Ferrimonas balearica]MBY6225050.1 CoA-acylating methylmalonate-semialdehyde dehydrogenase [Ferrimonas balearica]
MTVQVHHLIGGEYVAGQGQHTISVTNPANNQPIAQLNAATEAEVNQAVAAAKAAQQEWKEVAVSERARVMLRYQHLLKTHHDELATILAKETGKTFEDAKGDVWRGIEVVEQAANIASMMMGETVENVARGIDSYSYIQPLGVCVGITPFNFPAMIPLWMFPMAIACGNGFVLKPSEQDPMTPMRLAELFEEAGAPKGLLNVVHGTKDAVDQLLTHQDVKAISFVGSVPVGQYIYKTGTENMKRVQAFAGAKNHMVIMPDADKQTVINQLVGASVGAAGQRCMAISVAVFVGNTKEWIPEVAEAVAKVRPGLWDDPEAGYGPLINPAAKARVLELIQSGKDEGANCLVDGSDFTVPGHESGNWVGPTVFSGVTPEMRIYQEEIFGPVLSCTEVDTLADAIALVNANPFGNGTSIFTNSGAAARKYQHEIEVGQVGINIPIPVPLPFFSFTGWKNSFYGDLHAYGKQAVRFYTETKTVTARWPESGIVEGQNLTIALK